ncbi:hypothetical protein WISP_74593 [Willisornis vidua]|uniref:Uncharacterized protein n=1 Tax=Willisornis vidua TaxID=1566151 RepID=A0ABQ9D6X5_9PASS|nr:hypothetical protein WISP_74593 [Willisornis vidua]
MHWKSGEDSKASELWVCFCILRYNPGFEYDGISQSKAAPGQGQVGQQQEFLRGKGGQVLKGVAQGGLEFPSLEMSKEGLAVTLRALISIWMTPEVFSPTITSSNLPTEKSMET